ncbi:unnamed protein product [Chrysoparadoxa australica]
MVARYKPRLLVTEAFEVFLAHELLPFLPAQELMLTASFVCRRWRSWVDANLKEVKWYSGHLDMVGLRVIPSHAVFLSRLPARLASLDLSRCYIEAAELALLRDNAPCLTHLSLEGTRLGSTAYREMIRLRHLTSLNISGCDLSCGWMQLDALEIPAFAATLVTLDCRNSNLWARWDMRAFPSLTSMQASWTQRLTGPVLGPTLSPAVMGLKHVTVCDVKLAELGMANTTSEALTTVQSFGLVNARLVHPFSPLAAVPRSLYVTQLLRRLPLLQQLRLAKVDLDDELVSALCQGIREMKGVSWGGLKLLDIACSPQVTASGYETLFRSGVIGYETEFVYLSNCQRLGDSVSLPQIRPWPPSAGLQPRSHRSNGRGPLKPSPNGRSKLSVLHLTGSHDLTLDGVMALVEHCPGVTSLNLSGCRGVSSSVVPSLLSALPALRYLKAWGIGPQKQSLPAAPLPSSSCKVEWVPPHPAMSAEAEDEEEEAEPPSPSPGPAHVAVKRDPGWAVRCGCLRIACADGCGAIIPSCMEEDHSLVCPNAVVGCLLEGYGCRWKGTKQERDSHSRSCPLWNCLCMTCGEFVHYSAFSSHCMAHSLHQEDILALAPRGCPLRSLGCVANASPSHTTQGCSYYLVKCPCCGQDTTRQDLVDGTHALTCSKPRHAADVMVRALGLPPLPPEVLAQLQADPSEKQAPSGVHRNDEKWAKGMEETCKAAEECRVSGVFSIVNPLYAPSA